MVELDFYFGVVCRSEWEHFSSHYGDACKQKESDESKFESPFQKISSVWKIDAYDFLMRLSFFLSRVTIFKSERETKIISP
jgi:hypothetical protein